MTAAVNHGCPVSNGCAVKIDGLHDAVHSSPPLDLTITSLVLQCKFLIVCCQHGGVRMQPETSPGVKTPPLLPESFIATLSATLDRLLRPVLATLPSYVRSGGLASLSLATTTTTLFTTAPLLPAALAFFAVPLPAGMAGLVQLLASRQQDAAMPMQRNVFSVIELYKACPTLSYVCLKALC